MKKFILDLTVNSVEALSDKHVLIKLTDDKPLPEMLPGQFVEIRVDNSPSTFLRRPISINNVDYDANELWLLVAAIGEGTKRLQQLKKGDRLNCVLPLGNSFTMPTDASQKVLLVGGGVGVAPLLYFGKKLKAMGVEGKALIVTNEMEKNVYLSARNIAGVKASYVGMLNVYDILNHEKFIVAQDAVAKLQEVYA